MPCEYRAETATGCAEQEPHSQIFNNRLVTTQNSSVERRPQLKRLMRKSKASNISTNFFVPHPPLRGDAKPNQCEGRSIAKTSCILFPRSVCFQNFMPTFLATPAE